MNKMRKRKTVARKVILRCKCKWGDVNEDYEVFDDTQANMWMKYYSQGAYTGGLLTMSGMRGNDGANNHLQIFGTGWSFGNPMEGADFIPQEINCVFEQNNGGQLEYYNYCMLILYNALSWNLEDAPKADRIPVCMLGGQKFFELDEVSCILTNTLGDPTNCFSKYILG